MVHKSVDDDFGKWFEQIIDEIYNGEASDPPGGGDTDESVIKVSEKDRRPLDDCFLKIKEIFDEVAASEQEESAPPSRPEREPTAHQVIYKWISSRPAKRGS